MASDWPTYIAAISAGAAAVSAVFTMTAARSASRTVKEVKEQSEELTKQTRVSTAASISQAYGALAERMSFISQIMLDHPEWVPLFYEDAPVDTLPQPVSQDDESKLMLLCEAIADFADVMVEQRRSERLAVGATDWSTWEAYFRFLYQHSPVLRRYITENFDFYPDYEFAVFGYVVAREPLTGVIASAWHAREVDRGNADDEALLVDLWTEVPPFVGQVGYPWVRTWIVAPDDASMIMESLPSYVGPNSGGRVVLAVDIPARPTGVQAGVLAEVHVRWRGELGPVDLEAIQSWVLGTLASSQAIRYVDVCVPGSDRRRFDIRHDDPLPKTRESYCLPQFAECLRPRGPG